MDVLDRIMREEFFRKKKIFLNTRYLTGFSEMCKEITDKA